MTVYFMTTGCMRTSRHTGTFKGSLTVSVGELPQEAQELIGDIDSTIERISGEMREKIIRLYNILADDNLSDVDVQGPEDE